jgi:hypothetical protein
VQIIKSISVLKHICPQGHCAHFEARLESLADSTQIPHHYQGTYIDTVLSMLHNARSTPTFFNPSQKLKTSHPFQAQNKPSIWDRLQKSTLEKNRNFL